LAGDRVTEDTGLCRGASKVDTEPEFQMLQRDVI